MTISPFKLIIFRLYNITFCRIPLFSKILRNFLVRHLIKNANNKYVATSKYFDWSEIS